MPQISIRSQIINTVQSLLSPSPLFKAALACMGIFVLIYQMFVLIPLVGDRTDVLRDINCYYNGAYGYLHKTSLYPQRLVYTPSMTPTWYLYTPQLAILLSPIALYPLALIAKIWYGVELAGYWGYAYVLNRIVSSKATIQGTLIAGALISLTPRIHDIFIGENIDPVLWLLFGLGFLIPARSGILWAIVLQIKPWTLFPSIVLFSNDKKAARSFMATVLIGYVGAFCLAGASSFRDYIKIAAPIVAQGTAYPPNISISFGILRLLSHEAILNFHMPLPTWARLFLTASALAIPSATFFLTRKMHVSVRYLAVTAAGLLASPLCWAHYLGALGAPIALILSEYYRSSASSQNSAEGIFDIKSHTQIPI